jgi:phosphoserine aminotransferase
MYGRVYNFSAGPAVLPVPVLERARDEMLNLEGSGMSVMEMSHRSKDFEKVLDRAENGLRQQMGIPDDYVVLFLQGGASLQFAMVPMNLALPGKPVDVIHTGAWTKLAMVEIEKVAEYRLAGSTEADKFRRIPRPEEIELNPGASYVHIVSNNTIFGSQWPDFPDTGEVPLVADMSSDILSRQIDVSKFGLIFAGAQKNIGPSGVTIVIMRPDLAERADAKLPTMLQYRTHIKTRSLYNTPPTFGIYMVALVMEWMAGEGGVPAIQKRNEEKADLLYQAINNSELFYCPVEPGSRSKMNVVFRAKGDDEELEAKCIAAASAAGLKTLKGHRSVGGLRASIYNAMPMDGVKALVDFLEEFERKNG